MHWTINECKQDIIIIIFLIARILRPCSLKFKVPGVDYGLLRPSVNANNQQDTQSRNNRDKRGLLETERFCEC